MRVVVCLAVLVPSLALAAIATDPSVEPGRITGLTARARRVVIGSVVSIESSFRTNEFGDQLIASDVTLAVEETLKGTSGAIEMVTIEGGTVGGVTLRVSDMPALRAGERVVLFVDGTPGPSVPVDRGRGILQVDADGRVRGSRATLGDVRRLVRGAMERAR